MVQRAIPRLADRGEPVATDRNEQLDGARPDGRRGSGTGQRQVECALAQECAGSEVDLLQESGGDAHHASASLLTKPNRSETTLDRSKTSMSKTHWVNRQALLAVASSLAHGDEGLFMVQAPFHDGDSCESESLVWVVQC